MTTLRLAFQWLAIAGAIGLLFWGNHQRNQAEQARAVRDAERIQQLGYAQQRLDQSLTTLASTLTDHRQSQQRLQQTVADLRQSQATDQLRKKELHREDPDYQNWADQPLPDAARRLHQRPAITGADAYRQWLPNRHALQPTTDGPTE